jgi:hypothetical protein
MQRTRRDIHGTSIKGRAASWWLKLCTLQAPRLLLLLAALVACSFRELLERVGVLALDYAAAASCSRLGPALEVR